MEVRCLALAGQRVEHTAREWQMLAQRQQPKEPEVQRALVTSEWVWARVEVLPVLRSRRRKKTRYLADWSRRRSVACVCYQPLAP